MRKPFCSIFNFFLPGKLAVAHPGIKTITIPATADTGKKPWRQKASRYFSLPNDSHHRKCRRPGAGTTAFRKLLNVRVCLRLITSPRLITPPRVIELFKDVPIYFLYVVYTMRSDEIFRIISARPITKQERKQYEEQ